MKLLIIKFLCFIIIFSYLIIIFAKTNYILLNQYGKQKHTISRT